MKNRTATKFINQYVLIMTSDLEMEAPHDIKHDGIVNFRIDLNAEIFRYEIVNNVKSIKSDSFVDIRDEISQFFVDGLQYNHETIKFWITDTQEQGVIKND